MRRHVLGLLILLVGRVASAQSACGTDPAWCDRTSAGADRIPGTADDQPACVANAGTGGGADCAQHEALRWTLNEGGPCLNCRYELFMAVSCGDRLWLVLDDAQAMQVGVTDAATGAALYLSGSNECARRRGAGDPFIYCDGCATPAPLLLAKDDPYSDGVVSKPAGTCVATSPLGPIVMTEAPCLAWRGGGDVVAWGAPMDPAIPDIDGDGYVTETEMATPPCSGCGAPPCACGAEAGSHRAADDQAYFIEVSGIAATSRVLRIELLSGDAGTFSLHANCDAHPTRGTFTIHDTCAAASAALGSGTGRPNLSLGPGIIIPFAVADDGECPDALTVMVSIRNSGDVAASSVPFRIEWTDGVTPSFSGDNAAHPTDPACQGPLDPGTSRICTWRLTDHPALPTSELMVVTVDPDDVIDECVDPLRGREGCDEGPESASLAWCGGGCSVQAALAATPSSPCLGAPVQLTASASRASRCASALEAQFEDEAGNPLPGGAFPAPDPLDWVPPSAGDHQVFARVRCAAAPSCSALSAPVTVSVGEPPSFPGPLSAAAEGRCGIRLDWTAGAGGGTYDVYRDDASPVPLDASHRVASSVAATTWLDTVSGPGPFHYRVQLVNGCGRAPNADGERSASPAPPDFPGAVRAAAEGECLIRVDWDAAADSTVTYDIYRSDALPVALDAAHRVASGLAGTTHLDAPPWGAAYAYRVEAVSPCARAANGAGDSNVVSPVDVGDPVFAGISDTRDLGACQVEVSWDVPATDACAGVAGYDVYRDHGVAHAGETLVASLVPASPYVDTTPGNGTWVYVVRAVDRAGHREMNTVFQQESEGSCTNDFPRDAGLDREDGVDPPNGDRGHAGRIDRGGLREASGPLRLERPMFHEGMRIAWKPSPDEGGPYPVTYAVLRGDCATLRAGRYSHALVAPGACGLTGHEYVMMGQGDGAASYYVVVAVSGDNATFGYDSSGREIPDSPVCPIGVGRTE